MRKIKGIYYSNDTSRKRKRRWYCQRSQNGVRKFKGYFTSFVDALVARRKLDRSFMA